MEHQAYLHQLLHLPQVQDAKFSPDGRWIAFEWYHRHANMDVFVVPADGSTAPIALTHTPEMTQLVSWTPDSRAVIVSEDHDRDEFARLLRVELQQPGRLLPLTEERPPYFLHGGELSPDGRYLYYSANYDFDRRRVLEPGWVYRHDIRSGERIPIAKPEKPAWVRPELNHQGTHLLYNRSDRHPAGVQVHLVDVQGNEDRELFYFGDQVKTSACWFPDGERILVLSESTRRGTQDYLSLGVVHLASGAMQWLIDDPARSIEDAQVTHDGLIVVDEIIQAGHHPSFVDPHGGVETSLPAFPGNLRLLGRNVAGEWVGIYYSSTQPMDLVRIAQGAQSPADFQSLTGVWGLSEMTPGDLTPAEALRWQSEDGQTIQGWLYRARPNTQHAIITIHGGPTAHAEDAIEPEIQYYVRCGFNVLDVNYRGSTGFGLRFREMIKEDGWGGREQVDIACGARALIAARLAMPGSVGVTGTSYGGYSSWFLITHYPRDVISASAPICGMTDLVVDYETTRPDCRRYSEEMIGGTPDQVPEKYRERSPIHSVYDIQGALLIVQGALDPNVSPENVRQVETRLKAHNIPYQKLVFADEGHGVLKTANQETLYQRLGQFFQENLPS